MKHIILTVSLILGATTVISSLKGLMSTNQPKNRNFTFVKTQPMK